MAIGETSRGGSRGAAGESIWVTNPRLYDARVIVLGLTAMTKGGVWRHVRDLALGLRSRGHEVALGLVEGADELRGEARSLRLPVTALHRSARDPQALLHLHLHNTYDVHALRLLASRRRCGPTVLTEHLPRTDAADDRLLADAHTPGTRPLRTAFKRLQFTLADRVIAVSLGSRVFLEERYGALGEKIAVVHNGVPAAHAAARDRPASQGPMLVVLLGSLIVQKGHDVLVEAAHHATQDWRAEVHGSGPHLERLAAAAADVPGRVSFMGWSDRPQEVVDGSDVVCVPSRWEASSYGALEAMAASVAVVASRIDGLDEIVEDGVTGRLVPTEDPRALAAALDELAADAGRRTAMGVAGHARVTRLWSLDAMVGGTEDVYADARRVAHVRRRHRAPRSA
jgi:glycosyltransferase involved in cell wall biosynthesis